MPNPHKRALLTSLRQQFGDLRKLPGSESLFVVGDDAARVYVRYSKVHPNGGAFFGLRQVDLRQLEGRNAFICFLTDSGSTPVFVPYADFEEVFHGAVVATDGQYKVQLIAQQSTHELYVAKRGRFNVDGYIGLETLTHSIDASRLRAAVEFTHGQIQTLLAGIGNRKGYSVFIPRADTCRLDWSLCSRFDLREGIPTGFQEIEGILSEIDVIWTETARGKIEGLFEVEHSTPVYSGLLRFNDVLLSDPSLSRFFIVSNDARRDLFARQIFRPTFRHSGLAELTSFLDYVNVVEWYSRLSRSASSEELRHTDNGN